MRISVIIPAAGRGKRMLCASERKPFMLLGGRPIVEYALGVFEKLNGVKEIILAVNKKDLKAAKRCFRGRPKIKVVRGGHTRADSVYNCIKALEDKSDIVLIHDAVRPFVTRHLALASIKAAGRFGAAVVAVPVIPTVKAAGKNGFVAKTLERSRLWETQTPQAFKRDVIVKAYENCRGTARRAPTDDAMLVEDMGRRVKLVMGSYRNIKITTPQDLIVAEAMLTPHAHRVGVVCKCDYTYAV